MTFLQNSVREPKLQLEGMKSKLYAAMRMKARIEETIAEYGVETVIACLRRTLTDTARRFAAACAPGPTERASERFS